MFFLCVIGSITTNLNFRFPKCKMRFSNTDIIMYCVVKHCFYSNFAFIFIHRNLKKNILQKNWGNDKNFI